MAREGGKDRGLFQRKGSPDWWIRWACPYGHEHQEKIGPKSLARMVYQRSKVAIKADGHCLTQERDKRHREQAALFRVMGMDRLEEENERPRPISQDEEARLFAVLPEHYKPVVTLALNTGLRLRSRWCKGACSAWA